MFDFKKVSLFAVVASLFVATAPCVYAMEEDIIERLIRAGRITITSSEESSSEESSSEESSSEESSSEEFFSEEKYPTQVTPVIQTIDKPLELLKQIHINKIRERGIEELAEDRKKLASELKTLNRDTQERADKIKQCRKKIEETKTLQEALKSGKTEVQKLQLQEKKAEQEEQKLKLLAKEHVQWLIDMGAITIDNSSEDDSDSGE